MNRILLFLFASLLFLACNDGGRYESVPSMKDGGASDFTQTQRSAAPVSEQSFGFDVSQGGDYTVNGMVEAEAADFVAVRTGDSRGAQGPAKNVIVPRKLIRKGSMHCRVNSLDSVRGQLLTILKSVDGYVSSESASSNINQNLSFTLRIPEDNFDGFIFGIEGISKEVLSRNISVNDVTDQYVDIAARLSTKRALHARYTQLLSKAKNVKEVIEVERELAKVLADIESSEVRLKSLGDRASYATLNLSFSIEKEPVTQATFFSDFGDSLSAGWTGAKMAVLLGATLWPLLLFGLMLFFGIRWFLNRRTARQKLKLD